VFGRGGEEALALEAAGVPFEVVPGVTAGVGVPAYAGIPVTHRQIATSVTFITGHTARGAEGVAPDLSRLALDGTLCFYMGVSGLPALVASLKALGRSGATPAAAIEWGTYARQRTVVATLDSLQAACTEAKLAAPALLIVGEVVALRDRLRWFEAKPLFGLRIAVTHAAQRHGPLETQLRELGANVLPFATVAFTPVDATAPEHDDAPSDFSAFDWIVLTTVNAAEALFARLDALDLDARALAGVRLCAIGNSTLDAVRQRFLRLDATPENYDANALVHALLAHGPLNGQRVLVPRAEIARSSVPAALREAGAHVTEWSAYTATLPPAAAAEAAALLQDPPGLVIFTNAQAVRHFAQALGSAGLSELAATTAFASIGPVTTQAAQQAGLPIAIEPARHDVPSLIEALCTWRASAASGEIRDR
jgi:uroporphyrinogen III methyltransferase/synthase